MIQSFFRFSWGMARRGVCLRGMGAVRGRPQRHCDQFEFTPSSLTVVPGETVAFINIEGLHGVNGDSAR